MQAVSLLKVSTGKIVSLRHFSGLITVPSDIVQLAAYLTHVSNVFKVPEGPSSLVRGQFDP